MKAILMSLLFVLVFWIGYFTATKTQPAVEQQGPCPQISGSIKVTVEPSDSQMVYTFNIAGKGTDEWRGSYIGLERKKP